MALTLLLMAVEVTAEMGEVRPATARGRICGGDLVMLHLRMLVGEDHRLLFDSPSTQMVVRRPLQDPVLGVHPCFFCWHQIPFNLLADVTMWRLSSFIAAFFGCCTPSGVVPGCAVAASDRRLVPGRDDGPDCDSVLQSRVLCAILQDWVVIRFFFRVLVVSCTPTAEF